MKEIKDYFEKAPSLEVKAQKAETRKFVKKIYAAFEKGKITKGELIKTILRLEDLQVGSLVPILQVILLTKEIKAKEFEIGGTKEEKLEKLSLLVGNL